MPIPTPNKHEPKNKFVSRCTAAIYPEYKDHQGQAVAICEATWRKHKANAAYVIEAGGEEYVFAKEPIDSDIEKRRKTAGDPPAGTVMNPTPKAGKPEKVDSMDDGAKPDIDQQQWFLGSYSLEPVLDEHTGLAKWPLSFKRIEKDTKRPGKPGNPKTARPGDQKPEQPPTCA